ncbi:unnamed protein product [Darwinula stevensoni]|uniref:UPAR/Ly6 domain-containing protein n=1 Tax=Darwinula stevensoni TaxID=69355 RepID=A0A7R9AAM5_9CRUS|nr:unnamed protein product [Darwinula stevensoni]CAG0898606.1 unnamed protein product [Darwinula stevensoni]
MSGEADAQEAEHEHIFMHCLLMYCIFCPDVKYFSPYTVSRGSALDDLLQAVIPHVRKLTLPIEVDMMRVKMLLAFVIIGPATMADALKCIYCGPVAGSGIPSCDGKNYQQKTCSSDYQNPTCMSAYASKGGKLLFADCADTVASGCIQASSNDTQAVAYAGMYQCACKTDLCNGPNDASALSFSPFLLVFLLFVGGHFIRF